MNSRTAAALAASLLCALTLASGGCDRGKSSGAGASGAASAQMDGSAASGAAGSAMTPMPSASGASGTP